MSYLAATPEDRFSRDKAQLFEPSHEKGILVLCALGSFKDAYAVIQWGQIPNSSIQWGQIPNSSSEFMHQSFVATAAPPTGMGGG